MGRVLIYPRVPLEADNQSSQISFCNNVLAPTATAQQTAQLTLNCGAIFAAINSLCKSTAATPTSTSTIARKRLASCSSGLEQILKTLTAQPRLSLQIVFVFLFTLFLQQGCSHRRRRRFQFEFWFLLVAPLGLKRAKSSALLLLVRVGTVFAVLDWPAACAEATIDGVSLSCSTLFSVTHFVLGFVLFTACVIYCGKLLLLLLLLFLLVIV